MTGTGNDMQSQGKLAVIGIGPGSQDQMTAAARTAIEESDIILGYRGYVNLIASLLSNKRVISSGMRQEMERARQSVELASAGSRVAVVCSGDAGVYGMASPILEVAHQVGANIEVVIVPGVPSPQSAASLLGAPLANDYAVISLSDLLTPWDAIAKRLALAAEGDFVLVLMNPASTKRTWQLEEAMRLILEHRSPTTPVGIVTNAYRDGQRVVLTTISDLAKHNVGMSSTLVVGNSLTFSHAAKMITPRGYKPPAPPHSVS